jgi:peptidoglycan/LPS O-acetylase OafA/YrhL
MSDAGKIGELESVRGLAALLVVLFHVPPWNPDVHALPLLRHTYLMVELFFVLSGFVMYINYAERLKNGADVLRFQWLRFGRLYPVHLLFLLAFLGIEGLRWFAESRQQALPGPEGAFAVNDATAFVENLLLVHALGFSDSALTFNYPSWSISVEFYTYLVFAGVCLFAARWKLAVFVIGAAGLVAASVFMKSWAPLLDPWVKCLAGFFLGCCMGALYRRGTLRVPSFMASLVIFAFALFLWFKPAEVGVFLLAALLIVSLVCSDDSAVKRALRGAPFLWLGKISYSVYMCHAAVLWGMTQLVRHVVKAPEAMVLGRMVPQLDTAGTWIAIAVSLLLVIAVGAMVNRLIEEPGRVLTRKLVGLR